VNLNLFIYIIISSLSIKIVLQIKFGIGEMNSEYMLQVLSLNDKQQQKY